MSDIGDSSGAQDGGTYDPGRPIGVLGNLPSQWSVTGDDPDTPILPGYVPGQSSIFGDAFNPRPWTLADSSLNFFVDPETMKTIDFDGTAPPQTPPWLDASSGAAEGQSQPQPSGDGDSYTGLTPWQPDTSDGGMAGGAMPSPANGGKDGWVQLPQPGDLEAGEGGSGYYTYGTDKSGKPGTGPNAQWGTPKTMQVIGAVAGKLASGDQYTPLVVGNISLQNGADFSGPYGHSGHTDGLGIDVRPARTDGAQTPVTYKDPAYDQAATQRLVDAFRSTGQVSRIYFNDPLIHGVQPLRGHDNHLHVQLKP
ncbi:MAG TPA: hypothetical protein VHC39_16265 [Rhizomicrobium sp.]|nr:hypothetical protein [Rhizomicrobium sp.]